MEPLAPGSRVGNYVVEAQLGRGGMAEVWRARHVKLGSMHAIKVLLPEIAAHPEVRARFLVEGRIQAQVRHEGLVPVTDLLEEGAFTGLVMDYVEGEGLDALLRGPEPPPFDLLRRVFVQVLEALSAVHARGIVHRDLKPSNILLDRSDGTLRARLLDFGIAHVQQPEGLALTRAGTTLGTVYFMSPEQVRGEPVSAQSDVFSMGVILYRAATGKLPFDGDTQWKVLTAIASGTYEAPASVCPTLPPAFCEVIGRAMAPLPADRFASCAEFAAALSSAASPAKDPPATSPASVPPAAVKESRSAAGDSSDAELAGIAGRRRWMLVLGGIAVAALVAVVALRLADRPAPQGPGQADVDALVRGTVQRDPHSGLAFVLVPGGRFLPGCSASDELCMPEEIAAREPVVVPGFWIGRTEVTVDAYSRCAKAGACSAKAKKVENAAGITCNWGRQLLAHPVNCVTWDEAAAFCAWAGGRLPRAVEWEYAARSGRAARFPWGDAPPGPQHAQFALPDGGTAPVGTHAAGQTLWGLLDLAGNVWEWTSDGMPDGEKQLRGGSFKSEARALRVTRRIGLAPDLRSDSVGFRCASDQAPDR